MFSLAAAALIGGRLDAAFARFIRPWALAAWCFLTLGIAMGSYWAYYTLGWGGFWFWDPVENASLMPWLAGTALLHSAAVMEKREALKVWTIFLAIVTFSLSLLGTFLVRSGVLTSVHSFASDPRRGLFILAILVMFIGGALFLFMLRASSLKQGGLFAPISREGALVVNNLLLTAACAAVLVGTLYPLALESINGDKISVGAPFFNLTFGPLFAPILLLAPLGQLLAWKRGDLLAAAQRLFFAAGLGLAAMAVFAAVHGAPVMAVIGSGVAVYLIVGAFVEIVGRIFPSGFGATKNAFFRASGLPLSAWGSALAHAGLGLSMLGIAATGWGVEKIVAMKQGDVYDVGPYQIEVIGVTTDQGPNYQETVAHMSVKRDGHIVALLAPSKRFFATRRMANRPGRHRHAQSRPDLCQRRRAQSERRDRRAALLEAAGLADLDRRPGHGFRRPAEPQRPAPARRRRPPRGKNSNRGAGGGMMKTFLRFTLSRHRFAVARRTRRESQGNGRAKRALWSNGPAKRALWSNGRAKRALWLAMTVLVLLRAAPALAVEPGEMLKDPKLEQRARKISEGLRCLVCQNELIDDSGAQLAHDLRVLVRERLKAGASDQQVKDYLVSRYGNFILLKPPLEWDTLLLWLSPFAILALGAGAALRNRRKGRESNDDKPAAPLSEEESARLNSLLEDGRA